MNLNDKSLTELTALLIGFVVIITFASIMGALPTMFLWNWLIPSIFGLREINFSEALGLMVLSGLLIRPIGSSSSK